MADNPFLDKSKGNTAQAGKHKFRDPRWDSKIAQGKMSPQDWCDRGNAMLATKEFYRTDIEWVVGKEGKPIIRFKHHPLGTLKADEKRRHLMDRRGQPMSESDTFALNKELERLGATKRYRSDGTRYDA